MELLLLEMSTNLIFTTLTTMEESILLNRRKATLDSCSGLVLKIDRTIDSVKLHGRYLNALLMFKAF